MYKGLHVFDLDHTLLTANSSYRFGWYLHQQRFFSTPAFLYCLAAYARHKGLGLSVQKLHETTFSALFQGRLLRELEKHVEAFLSEQADAWLYSPACARLEKARKEGCYTVISSSSPDFLVAPIAKKFKVDAYFATTYLPDQKGYLACIGMVKDGKQKAADISALAEQLKVPLASTTAYSDSYVDLPLLEVTGVAVGVKPERVLRKICQKRGWEII